MKKIMYVELAGLALVSAVMTVTGCGTTKAVVATVQEVKPEKSAKVGDENNTNVSAVKTTIIDWQDRTIGAKVNPEWLISMIHGNGNKYLAQYGMSEEYTDNKWIPSSAQDASKDNAEAIAESEVEFAVASEMSLAVNATVGANLSDGQKDAIRTVCANTSATLTGIGKRGSYWQLEETEDAYGNTKKLYNYYVFYSCPKAKYNELLNVYLISLLQSKGLDEKTINEIKTHAQQILDDAQEQSDRVEAQKDRELRAQLSHEETTRTISNNETKQIEAAERTNQVKSNNDTIAEISTSGDNASVARHATMNPALAALLH